MRLQVSFIESYYSNHLNYCMFEGYLAIDGKNLLATAVLIIYSFNKSSFTYNHFNSKLISVRIGAKFMRYRPTMVFFPPFESMQLCKHK